MPDPSPTSLPSPTTSRRAITRWLGFVIGITLLFGAAWAVYKDRANIDTAMANLRTMPWHITGLLVVLPCCNWLLTAAMFHQLLRQGPDEPRFSNPPTGGEMVLLIGAAWLANYAPVRPGLFGRVAYHKAVNGVPIARTVHSIICAILCGAVGVGTLLAACYAATALGWSAGEVGTAPRAAALIAAPILIWTVLAFVAGRVRPQWKFLGFACVIRYMDVLVWMARYALVFSIAGKALNLPQAAAVAAVSQAAMLFPLVGNGLGVREFAIGLAGAALPRWFIGDAADQIARNAALTADLLNRVGELFAAVPVGLVCAYLLLKLARRAPETHLSQKSDG